MADPLSVGANVVTFVVLALKSAKILHTVLKGIKDGPENVRQAAAEIYGLLSILEQLAECRALDESGSDGLTARLQSCIDDLEAFDGKLKGLTVEDNERKHMRYWKSIKAVWNEKEIDRMGTVVAGHTSALNLHLSALQSDTVFEIPSQLRSIDTQLVSQYDQLLTIKKELASQRTIRESEIGIWSEQQRIFGKGFDAMKQEMQVMSSLRTTQDAQIQERLDDIFQLLLERPLEYRGPSGAVKVEYRKSSSASIPSEERSQQTCAELMTSMTRLCKLVSKMHGRTTTNEAKDIIGSLLDILSCMRSGEMLQGVVSSGLVKRTGHEKYDSRHVEDLRTSLSSVHGILLTARHVTLNEKIRVERNTKGQQNRTYWTTKMYDLGIGILVVSSCEVRIGDQATEEVTTYISLIPSPTQRVFQILGITSHQSFGDHGVFSSIPNLSVKNIRPASSPVFTIVKEGRLDDFLTLLRNKEASVRDHDEYVAGDLDMLLEEEELERTLACRKYLLDAGCDPTISVLSLANGKEDGGAILDAFNQGIPEAMKVILDHGDCFFNVRTTMNYGVRGMSLTPLLILCWYDCWSVEAFELLLQRGASLQDRDSDGNTCLHLCVRSISIGMFNRFTQPSRYTDGLVYLIRQGADVWAKNFDGIPVSEFAYDAIHAMRGQPYGYVDENGSLRGDIWDCALTHCGYDISDFRGGRQREAVYTRSYKKRDFDDIWAGCKYPYEYYYDNESMVRLFSESVFDRVDGVDGVDEVDEVNKVDELDDIYDIYMIYERDDTYETDEVYETMVCSEVVGSH